VSKMLIGLHGPARSGKTSVGNILSGEMNIPTYALALPLKEAANSIFGWDQRHAEGELKEIEDPFWGVSPRRVYQTLGTEWGRNTIRDDLWLRRAEMVLNKAQGLVITDIRFPNERDWLLDHGGVMVHVIRHDIRKVAAHSSEAGLPVGFNDYVLLNNRTLDDLIADAKEFANHLMKTRFSNVRSL
jgi:hypothetical protein